MARRVLERLDGKQSAEREFNTLAQYAEQKLREPTAQTMLQNGSSGKKPLVQSSPCTKAFKQERLFFAAHFS